MRTDDWQCNGQLPNESSLRDVRLEWTLEAKQLSLRHLRCNRTEHPAKCGAVSAAAATASSRKPSGARRSTAQIHNKHPFVQSPVRSPGRPAGYSHSACRKHGKEKPGQDCLIMPKLFTQRRRRKLNMLKAICPAGQENVSTLFVQVMCGYVVVAESIASRVVYFFKAMRRATLLFNPSSCLI